MLVLRVAFHTQYGLSFRRFEKRAKAERKPHVVRLVDFWKQTRLDV
jgi:hypothetical protein